MLPRHNHFLDFADRGGRVQTLGAGFRAVQNRVAAVEFKRIFQRIEAFARRFIAAVDQPTVRLQQNCRAQIFIAIPPITWA